MALFTLAPCRRLLASGKGPNYYGRGLLSNTRSISTGVSRIQLALCRPRLPAAIRILSTDRRTSFLVPQSAAPFHTSSPRPIPPALLVLIKPLTRLWAALLGRAVRRRWQRLSAEEKEAVRQKLRRNSGVLAALGVGFCAFSLYLYETHIEECPITGRRRFVALKAHQMEKIAATEFKTLLSTYQGALLPNLHPAYDRVARVANKILQSNQDLDQVHDKDWTITVINQDVQNAFVLPSGNIFVFTGMLDVCSNDDQLGIILGHEISHTLLGHVAEKLSYANFFNLLLLLPMALVWAVLPNDGVALVFDWFARQVIDVVLELPFSRDMETEADEVGLQLAAKACLDVREAPAFWAKMAALEEARGSAAAAEAEPLPELLSTHPAHENRAERLGDLLPEALRLRTDCGCHRLLGPDPALMARAYKHRHLRKLSASS